MSNPLFILGDITIMNIGFGNFLLIVSGLTIAALCFMLQSEKAENEFLKQENVILGQTLRDEQLKAQKAISEANNRIQEYELDKKEYESTIKQEFYKIDKSEKEVEVRIVTELVKDDSAENQLNLIEGILHEFSSKK